MQDFNLLIQVLDGNAVTNVFEKFLSAFIVQLDDAFEQLEFWMAFHILDLHKLPEKKEDLIQYGNNELQG